MSNDSESDCSAYVRESEASRLIIQSGKCINDMRDNIIAEKKKNKALHVVTKEISDKYKAEKTRVTLLEQELEYYKSKPNKKINTSLSEQALSKLFEKKDAYIIEKSNENIEELIEQLRKQYL
jgi:hypothetical protein